MPELIGETGTEPKGSSFAIKSINDYWPFRNDWIYNPCIFDICSSCRGTFTSIAYTVFVAAIIGSFTLVGIIISQLFLNN
jgi:hypothetical protein